MLLTDYVARKYPGAAAVDRFAEDLGVSRPTAYRLIDTRMGTIVRKGMILSPLRAGGRTVQVCKQPGVCPLADWYKPRAQRLDLNKLAEHAGVHTRTVRRWLSNEALYLVDGVIFQLKETLST